jgi:hypothetical protein
MENPILFLDFDGVLNPYIYSNALYKMYALTPTKTKSRDQFGDYFAPWCVDELAYIVQFCDPDIVISSTWREYCDVKHLWEFRRLPGRIIGQTPSSGLRGSEVEEWLIEYGRKESKFVIVDDIDEFTGVFGEKSFVQTNQKYGLTRAETEKIISILSI